MEDNSLERPTMAEQKPKQGTVMRGPIDPFAEDMNEMVNNRENSDVKFLMGKTREAIYGHKAIISPRCKKLKTKFTKAAAADSGLTVELLDVAKESFLAVLEFIYTNCVTLTDATHAIDVLSLSITYSLEELRKLCNNFLVNNITITTASDIMQAAVTLQQKDLRNTALAFIEENTKEVFAHHRFHELKEPAMCEVLSSDRLDIDEMEIIEKIKEWAEMCVVTLDKSKEELARKVVKHIRLPLLSPDELEGVHNDNEKDRLIAESLFTNAFKVLLFKKSDVAGSKLTIPRTGTRQRDHHSGFHV